MKPMLFFMMLAVMTSPLPGQSPPPAPNRMSIVNSKHNLSVMGPGGIRAAGEQQVCIFCHTPHNSTAMQPLWNRMLPTMPYRVYSSSSLQAKPGQPTGSSKLCLSCHDGTIALGSVASRLQPIMMAGGVTTIPAGAKGYLGTDLRDDHPISFKYDSTLISKNTKLRNPAGLPAGIRLDVNQELQCKSCHDPHDNAFGKFLVMDNSASQLCNACHNQGSTTVTNHANCSACHQSHTAPSGPYLLKAAKVSDTCLLCHDGAPTPPQGPNVGADLKKVSMHDTSSAIDLPNPYPSNVTCADCHEPHTMAIKKSVAPNVPGNFGAVSGVNAGGGTIATASYEYEVCFKCHANQSATTPIVPRRIVQGNKRLQFDPQAVSFHPVEMAGKNSNVPSLKAPLTTSSIIYCSDCHASDNGPKGGGTGPGGTHGSSNRPLLVANYTTTDPASSGPTTYALCYRCHYETAFTQEGGPFKYHKKHVVEERAPCSVCHDVHGISSTQGNNVQNAHLINFDTRYVTAVRVNNISTLEYRSTGASQGQCTLSCHGKAHIALRYGPENATAGVLQSPSLKNFRKPR